MIFNYETNLEMLNFFKGSSKSTEYRIKSNSYISVFNCYFKFPLVINHNARLDVILKNCKIFWKGLFNAMFFTMS